MNDTLRDYARKLNSALAKRSGYQIFNRDATHAGIVIYLAFLHAEKRIWLLSNKLDGLIYSTPWLLEAVERFLNREGSEMRILLETDVCGEHPLLRLIGKNFPERVTVGKVPEKEVSNYGYNFLVVDDRGYRFEPDRNEFRALVAFDEEDETHQELMSRLKNVFRRLDDLAETV